MPILAIVLLLTSAFLHALWNFLLKRSQEKYIAMGWQVILSGVLAFFLLLFTGLPPRSMWLFALISMALEAVYFILLSNAYSDHDFSLVYPIARGTAPAFLMLWSILFLKEKLSLGGILGVSLIVGGMVIIGATSLIQNRGKPAAREGSAGCTVSCLDHFSLYIDRWDRSQEWSRAALCLDDVHVCPGSDNDLQHSALWLATLPCRLEGTAHSTHPRGDPWHGCLFACAHRLFVRSIKLFRRDPGGERGDRRVPGVAVPRGANG